MTWIIGIDEAGYGPNLGPFVMTSVACRVPAPLGLLPEGEGGGGANLWRLLHPAVRRSEETDTGQLLIDDSKRVYTTQGLAGLERGVFSIFGSPRRKSENRKRKTANWNKLAALIDRVCPDASDELQCEVWYRGVQPLPVALTDAAEWQMEAARFEDACAAADIGGWQVRSVVICPRRFNALLEEGGTKGHVLAHALAYLLRWHSLAHVSSLHGEEDLTFYIDKHGGRNTYAAMIQHALPDGILAIEQESRACSAYRVHGLGHSVRLTFQPRAEGEHFCVALASMVSKYLRELLMLEFNRFWQEQVPGLKPTAGYPGDAARFLQAIRPTIRKLGLREETLWRRK
jgi:ribonuclease HII